MNFLCVFLPDNGKQVFDENYNYRSLTPGFCVLPVSWYFSRETWMPRNKCFSTQGMDQVAGKTKKLSQFYELVLLQAQWITKNKKYNIIVRWLILFLYKLHHFTYLWPTRNHCQIYWRYCNPQGRTIKTFVGSLFQVLACIKQFFNRLHTVHTNSWAKDSKPKMQTIITIIDRKSKVFKCAVLVCGWWGSKAQDSRNWQQAVLPFIP